MTARSTAPRSTAHDTFVIERLLAAPPRRVFAAWSTPEAKRRWFACHDDWVGTEYHLDFRVGGSELNRVVPPGSVPHLFQAQFLDIVADQRIVYAYDMHVGDHRISVSLATVVFEPAEAGTRMIFTEQVVFLDGYADDGSRRRGTEDGIDRLALEVMETPAGPDRH
jgi:uncharacterized protein YndB with AHSA1/START domain